MLATHFSCCCCCSFPFYARSFGCRCLFTILTMYDIVVRGIACVRACVQWTHCVSNGFTHFGNRHIAACSPSNAWYACKLRRDATTTTTTTITVMAVASNEIMFRTICVCFSLLCFRHAHKHTHTHTIQRRSVYSGTHAFAHTVTYNQCYKRNDSHGCCCCFQMNWIISCAFFRFFFVVFGPQNHTNETKCAKQRKLFILDTVSTIKQYTIFGVSLCLSVFFPFFILVAYLIAECLIAVPNFGEWMFVSLRSLFVLGFVNAGDFCSGIFVV